MFNVGEVIVDVIPHAQQRYNTCGDWQWKGVNNTNLSIKVSDTGNSDFNHLLAVHEYIEALLCKAFGIHAETVDEWDMSHEDLDDPGDHILAPYHDQHKFATIVERMLAMEMDVDWDEYERKLGELIASRA